MKHCNGVLQRILGLLLAVMMLLSFAACNEPEQNDPDDEKPNKEGTAVMTIHGYEISPSVYTIMLYDAAVELKMEAEPDYEMTDEEYQEWFFNFYNTELDGEMPFDIARERVLEDLREYAYYMQAVEAAGITISDADRNDIETNVLISVGEEYDVDNPDDYFNYTFGITKDQYVDYLVDLALIDIYIDQMAVQETVGQEAIEEYLETYRAHYMVWSIQNIYLAAETEKEFTTKKALGETLAQRISDGEDMTALVDRYSEDGGEGDGIFVVSNDEWSYPPSILDWVYTCVENDVGVVEAEDGVYVLKCVKMEIEDDATEEIKYVLGVEQLKTTISAICKGNEYKPQINASVYDTFTKLPGDLMLGDNAVG